MRLLGLPLDPPQAILGRIASDLSAVARTARAAPGQLERMLALGEELAGIGRAVLEIAERLDRRAEAIMSLGERLDGRAQELLDLGGEIVDGATRVAETGGELISVLPALERAIEMTTPLEGAIDRFGRLVDRLPGGGTARRRVGPRTVSPGQPPSGRPPEGQPSEALPPERQPPEGRPPETS